MPVDALTRSGRIDTIYCAPGNAGIAAQAECVPIRETEVEALRDFALAHNVTLTVVGPEAALAAGIVDCFRAAGLRIFGPTKAAARIESSKEFAKELMAKYGIPTAGFRAFTAYEEARDYVASRPLPAVLKYDGLAAGKGVVIAQTMEEADAALRDMLLDDKFGHGKVVVEDWLEGPEFSFMCFVDRRRVYPMALAQDHKRAYDGDEGPNTGGMGAYSPLPFVTGEDERYALERIMQPVADAMCAEGCPFTGVLYGGLMKTRDRHQGDRVQRPFRRSRDGSSATAPEKRHRGDLLGRGRRLGAGAPARMARLFDGGRGAGLEGLSRQLCEGRRDRGAGRGRRCGLPHGYGLEGGADRDGRRSGGDRRLCGADARRGAGKVQSGSR